MNKLFVINEGDSVAVALCDLKKGYAENGVTLLSDVPFGHKVLLKDVKKGEKIIKYGNPIGITAADLPKGSYVHTHNLLTALEEKKEYSFSSPADYTPSEKAPLINAYKRKNGKIGIRNELWIIPTVGCVNNTAEMLAQKGREMFGESVFAFTHPYGCSQMSDDQQITRKTLAALISHPNAGGVLVVSLGCENTGFETLKPYLGDIDKERVKLLVCQNSEDELAEGERLLAELGEIMKADKREKVGADNLVIGFKCGGSDAFSGITANPLCGRINDRLTSFGASTILTEVPEMFGAEHLLMRRSVSAEIFEKQKNMVNAFKDYFESHGVVCYENPSPGNHDGGITTLEEKSLGCIQKGGSSPVCDVLNMGESVSKKGLNLLYGPGNDIVSTTNLTAAGAHIILFTTGRGTPLGAPVPTIKISSNSALFKRKNGWIDFDAGGIINNGFDSFENELFELLIQTAEGEPTKNERNGYRDIAIFKNGVTM